MRVAMVFTAALLQRMLSRPLGEAAPTLGPDKNEPASSWLDASNRR